MIYFLLPNVYYKIYENLDCITSINEITPIISHSLSNYLYSMKFKIDTYENEWDNYKKYTNPYEYINTIPPGKTKCISKYKPLSRSYYKMIEIIYSFDLIKHEKPIETFHLAEGPGGFIEAVVNIRNNMNDKYTGITLLDDINDTNIPAWKKSVDFLNNHKNVFIENGVDKTGNILSIDNFEYCVKKYGSKMHLLTADGGFDFSVDFNKQEISIAKLLFAQVAYAVCLQKKHGCFVLKIFDCFMQHTIDILYILSSFYKTTFICKPQTSRYANSEKYIVCKDFLYSSNEKFYDSFKQILELVIEEKDNIFRFLNTSISNIFMNKIEEYNAIFGQQQVETIYNTFMYIDNKSKNDKLDNIIKYNIQKSISWCEKHDVPCNKNTNTNVFLKEEDD